MNMRAGSFRYPLTAIVLLIGIAMFVVGCLKDKDIGEDTDDRETKIKEVIVEDKINPQLFTEESGIISLSIQGNKVAYVVDGATDTELIVKVGQVSSERVLEKVENIHSIHTDSKHKKQFSLEWVPGENKLSYITLGKKGYVLHLLDLASRQETAVHTFASGTHVSNVAFAEGGHQFFYSTTQFGSVPRASIIMNNAEMSAPMELKDFRLQNFAEAPREDEGIAFIQHSSISPDRKWVAFTLYNSKDKTYQLAIHDLTTNSTQVIAEGLVASIKPSWSPTSQFIAYTLPQKEQDFRVKVYDVMEQKSFQITKDIAASFSPSWLSDSEIIFGATTKTGAVVYQANLASVIGDTAVQRPEPITEEFDIAIKNGIVIDPETETIKFGYHVGIKGDTIEAITQAEIKGKQTIDATDLVISPGFIDVLSYNPNNVGNIYKVTDGVTTNLEMHGAVLDFESYFRQYGRQNKLLNYGGAIQQVRMRFELGIDRYASPTPQQIEKMKEMTEKAIKQGAIGISFSPEYYPGISSDEIKAIMEVGHQYGMTTFFHARYSTMEGEKTNIDALEEIIGYARELGASVQVSHINSTGGTFSMEQSLKMINDARAEGLDVTIDLYPYHYWATYANSARFDEGWRERFRIDYSDLQVGGSTERLTKETFEKYRKTRTLLIAFAIPEEDVELAIQEEHAMIGSDTIIQPGFNNHPRGAGTFARTIGVYARDKNTISLMQALRMMTINTVKRLENVAPALEKKGRLREGMDADITIFDYSTVIDTATPENTNGISKGIPYVMVNGVIVVDPEGVRKNVNPGRPIRSYIE